MWIISESHGKRYPINYEKLRDLVSIEGLKGARDPASSPQAHAKFMSQYSDIFIKPSKPPPVAIAQDGR